MMKLKRKKKEHYRNMVITGERENRANKMQRAKKEEVTNKKQR
jgi:hypothetical protein